MFQLYTIAIIALLAAMSPGPDFVVVTKNALNRSRSHGLSCTLGIGAGLLFHTAYCVMGLALLISQSIVLFNVIKYIGAAYLIYIGMKSLMAKETAFIADSNCTSPTNTTQHTSHLKAFSEGLLANVLNPKCTLFMLSLFTVVISPATSQWLKLGYGLEIILIAMLWFSLLSFGITITPIQRKLNRMQLAISRFSGMVLIGLGLTVALEGRQ